MHAVQKYFAESQKVEPIRKRAELQSVALASKRHEVAAVQTRLDAQQTTIDAITAEYESAITAKIALEEEIASLRARIDAASGLLSGLDIERSAGSRSLAPFLRCATSAVRYAPGTLARTSARSRQSRRSFSAVGSTTTDGTRMCAVPRTDDHSRARITKSRDGHPCPPSADRDGSFAIKLDSAAAVSRGRMARWARNGLPSDEQSLLNASLTELAICGGRCPMIIDPEQQARAWLSRRGSHFISVQKTMSDLPKASSTVADGAGGTHAAPLDRIARLASMGALVILTDISRGQLDQVDDPVAALLRRLIHSFDAFFWNACGKLRRVRRWMPEESASRRK